MTIQSGPEGSNLPTNQNGTNNKDQSSSWWPTKRLNKACKTVTDNPGYTFWGASLALAPIKYLFSQFLSPYSKKAMTLTSGEVVPIYVPNDWKIPNSGFSGRSIENLIVGLMQGAMFSNFFPEDQVVGQAENNRSKSRHIIASACNVASFLYPESAKLQEFGGWFNGINLALDFLSPSAISKVFKKSTNKFDLKEGEELDQKENLQKITEMGNKFREVLDAKLIGQTDAKEGVINAVTRHLMTSNLDDPKRATILLLGPTGTGKTTLVQALSEVSERPYVVIDGSALTPEGYIGSSFSDTWKKLLDAADGDVQKAERGIVFIDEVDKIFKRTDGKAANFQSIQNQLLKALEGSDVSTSSSRSPFGSSKKLNTKKMIFFLGGAFEGLDRDKEADGVTLDQLEEYGLSREFTGRISNIAQLNALDKGQLYEVLQLEKGVASIPSWKKEFLNIGAELSIDDAVIDQVISYAHQRQTGVRGVDFVLRQLLTPILYRTVTELVSNSSDSSLKVQVTMKDWDSSELASAERSRKTFPPLNEIQDALKKKVVGQDTAKAVIAEAIYNHHLNIKHNLNLPKGNVLMIGPSGCGKTYMMEVLSEETGLPLANIDASKLTRAGLVGSKPEEAIVRLLEQTGGDVSAAEKGIIFLDEIDKQFEEAANPMSGGGTAGRSTLNQLLKMMQGDKVTVQYKGKSKTVDTTNILFVMAGAFSRFPHLYQKEKLEDRDLLRCGVTPEFLGRTGYVTKLDELKADDYRKYLVGMGENSLITNWVEAFKKMGAELLIDDEVIEEIIEKALKTTTGIRGLQNTLRQLLGPKMVEVQNLIDAGVTNKLIHITKEVSEKSLVVPHDEEVVEIPSSAELVKTLTSSDFNETIQSGVTLVDFFADWCGPCRMMAPVLEEVAEEKKDQIKCCKVDLDQSEDLASEYQVTSLPTLILFKDGKEVKRVVGLQDIEALRALIAESE